MENTQRFSNRVENYVRYRPHYPLEIVSFLKNNIGLSSESIISDIGSGTGISSEIFLQNGNRVYAVEPNEEMRRAAEEIFNNNKNFISVNAKAESTSLPDNSIDVIVAGQAFHWFDKVKSKKEFQRIAACGANLVLMWNDRKLDTSFQQAYEKILREFAVDYEKVNHRNVDEKVICEFFSPFPYFIETFHNSQLLDFESLKGRLLSSSYAPLEHDANYDPMIAELQQIFNNFSINSKIKFEYSCNIYYGKMKKNS